MSQPAKKRTRAPHRITKIYTRGGDEGKTSLVGGQRVAKDDLRLEAYGTVDELQSFMGQACDELDAAVQAAPQPCADFLRLTRRHMVYLQNLLFTLSGDLATRIEDRWENMPLVGPEQIQEMERLIDAFNAPLPPLADFILPGGHRAVTAQHVCRVVCRRAERRAEALARVEPIGDQVRPCLNRLSDVFFVLGRRIGFELNRVGMIEGEVIWQRGLEQPELPE